MCGANVAIMDTDWHSLDAEQWQAGIAGAALPILIEEDVWLDMNVTVLKGVTIGARTIVAAGSVVSRSLPADVIAAGQPARVIWQSEKDFRHRTLVNS
jgi:acetyltransferase-like isoleucine patch superfamily enzyme